jgi:hypothetical protein
MANPKLKAAQPARAVIETKVAGIVNEFFGAIALLNSLVLPNRPVASVFSDSDFWLAYP